MRISPAVWKWGSCIAAVRLAVLWSQIVGFEYGDWRQLPGFVLTPLILPELLIMKMVLRYDQWPRDDGRLIAHLAVLIFFASYLYAALLVRLSRMRGTTRA